MSSAIESIKHLFFTMDYDNIILGLTLAESQQISLSGLYNELARVMTDCVFSPNVGWMNLPFHILLPQLQRIFTISIEYSTLTSLSDTFGFLQGIFLLEIQHCDIVKLPDSLQYLHRLKSFSMVDTPIEDLPMTLQMLPNLQCLYMRQTQIKNIPAVIAHCQHIKTLDLSENAHLSEDLDWELLANLPLEKLILSKRHEACLPAKYKAIVHWSAEKVS